MGRLAHDSKATGVRKEFEDSVLDVIGSRQVSPVSTSVIATALGYTARAMAKRLLLMADEGRVVRVAGKPETLWRLP